MITTALIGAGYIAREHLDALRDLPGVKTVGVSDLSAGMAEATAEEFGVAAWFTDHRAMLRELRPDVVHITTPPQAHLPLAIDALEAGAHALVEKPITLDFNELEELLRVARLHDRWLLEDYNYLFNPPVQKILELVRSGALGEVVHVDAQFFVNILGEGSKYADPNAPSPFLSLPGGAVSDFITHLAYLAHAFIGEHREAQTSWQERDAGVGWDEFRAVVSGERGTAHLAFSAHAQPDVFSLRVHGTRMRATASLFEPLLRTERLRDGPRPLIPLLNGLSGARAHAASALRGLWLKLQGRSATYEGLRLLLRQTYEALGRGGEPPIPTCQVEAVNQLVADLLAGAAKS